MNTTIQHLLSNNNANIEGSTTTDIPIFYYIIVLGSLMLFCLIMIMIFYWYHHRNLVKLIQTSSPSSRANVARDRVIKLGYISSNGSSITSPKSMESSLPSSPPPPPPSNSIKTHQQIIPIPTPTRSPNKNKTHLTTNSGTPWEIFAMNSHSLSNLHGQPLPATSALSPHQQHLRHPSIHRTVSGNLHTVVTSPTLHTTMAAGTAAYYNNNNNNNNHNGYGSIPTSVTSPNGTIISMAQSIGNPAYHASAMGINATAISYGIFPSQQQQQRLHVMGYNHNNLAAPVAMRSNNNNNGHNIGYGVGQKRLHKSSDVTIKSGMPDVAASDARTALTEVTTSSSEESVEEEENYDSVSTRMERKKKKKKKNNKKRNRKKHRKYKEEQNEDQEKEEEEEEEIIEDVKQSETVIEIDVDLEDEENDETENIKGNNKKSIRKETNDTMITFKQKEFVDPEAAPTMLSDITSSDDEEYSDND